MGQGLEFQYLIVPITSNVSRPRPDSCESLWSGYQGVGCWSTKQPWEQMTDNLWGLPFGTATQRSGNWGFEDMIIETVFGSSCGYWYSILLYTVYIVDKGYMVYQALVYVSPSCPLGRRYICVQCTVLCTYNMFSVWSVPAQKQCQVLQHGACLGIGAVLGCVCSGAVCSKGMLCYAAQLSEVFCVWQQLMNESMTNSHRLCGCPRLHTLLECDRFIDHSASLKIIIDFGFILVTFVTFVKRIKSSDLLDTTDSYHSSQFLTASEI